MRSLVKVGLIASAIVVGAVAWGDISGSAHDFSSQTWAGGRTCVVCHTPHNSTSAVVPLWDHASTGAAFTTYSSPTFTASAGQPSGASKACLSCHDGTVALDSFGGNTGTSFLTGPTLLGSDLSNDHPISFTYDSALSAADGGLHNPTIAPSGLLGTVRDDLLFNDRMECASCHDVHNSYNQSSLLVKSNAGSALCLTCHNK